jgi:uncharacterized protein (TIGR03437 family)
MAIVTHRLFAQAPAPSAIVNAASFVPASAPNGSLAPGSIATLFGTNLASTTAQAATTPVPTTLSDTNAVTVVGISAPLFFVSDKQVNLQIPFEAAPGALSFTVTRAGRTSAAQTVAIVPASPGIFTLGADNQGAILNTSSAVVNGAAPASPGDTVQVYCTGLGVTTPVVPTGAASPGPPATVNLPVTANIDGIPARVTFAGLAPGFVGLYQVNVQIPNGVVPGNAVPLVLTENGVSSNRVTLAVKAAAPGAVTDLAFSSPTTIQSGGKSAGGEPTLHIGGDSTLWVTDLIPSQIWKSTDRGVNWSYVAPAITIGGSDMDAAADDAGRLHILDQSSSRCIFYYRSSDGGKSYDSLQLTNGGGVWQASDGTCTPSGNGVDRPWILPWGKDTIYIVHKESNRIAGTVSVSHDAGQTFTHTSIAGDVIPQPQGAALDPVDGSVYLVAGQLGTFDNDLGRNPVHALYAATSPDGASFSASVIASSQQFDLGDSEFPSVAVDAAHNVYAAWAANTAGTVDIYLSVSRDRARTWSAPIRVSHDLTVATYPTITAGDAGRVAIAWYGTADPARSRGDAHGASWYVYAAVSTNVLDAQPSFETVRVSDQPMHHHSICSHLTFCDGADTTMSDPPGYERGIIDFFRIALDPAGALNVVYPDTTGVVAQTRFARQTGGPLLRQGQ